VGAKIALKSFAVHWPGLGEAVKRGSAGFPNSVPLISSQEPDAKYGYPPKALAELIDVIDGTPVVH